MSAVGQQHDWCPWLVADGPPNELPIRGTNRESSAAPLIAFPHGNFPTVGLGAIAEIGNRPDDRVVR